MKKNSLEKQNENDSKEAYKLHFIQKNCSKIVEFIVARLFPTERKKSTAISDWCGQHTRKRTYAEIGTVWQWTETKFSITQLTLSLTIALDIFFRINVCTLVCQSTKKSEHIEMMMNDPKFVYIDSMWEIHSHREKKFTAWDRVHRTFNRRFWTTLNAVNICQLSCKFWTKLL